MQQLWFHVKYERQKNLEISTLCSSYYFPAFLEVSICFHGKINSNSTNAKLVKNLRLNIFVSRIEPKDLSNLSNFLREIFSQLPFQRFLEKTETCQNPNSELDLTNFFNVLPFSSFLKKAKIDFMFSATFSKSLFSRNFNDFPLSLQIQIVIFTEFWWFFSLQAVKSHGGWFWGSL